MGSFKVLTVRGIPIRIHVTFPLILILAAYQGGRDFAGGWLNGAALGVVFTLLLFVCVVLHELAHSLVALHFNADVKEIVLLPLGGVARMERMPERPYQELLMALAGPVASALIGIGLALVSVAFIIATSDLGHVIDQVLAGGNGLQWAALIPSLALANLFLAAFNLIPAFPMDGGRVLRALLASFMPHGRATAIAVTIGQGLAWLIGLYGLLRLDVMAMLIAVFVYFGAAQERQMLRVKSALTGIKVRRVYSRNARSVLPDDPLGRAVDMTLEGFQSDFPVCDGQQLVGMLSQGDILVGLKEKGAHVPVSLVMRPDPLTVGPDEDLFTVHQKMDQAGASVVPVVEAGEFLGLLTRRDLEEAYGLVSALPGLWNRGELD
ncbi:MAG: site-2 protease family protein [Anaerolineae bacterium]|nr:site-2 protease family protein [Anaerolineae bacterium]